MNKIVDFFFCILCIMCTIFVGVFIYGMLEEIKIDTSADQQLQQLKHQCDSLQKQIDFMVE